MALGMQLMSKRKLKTRLGPPDTYPQDANQREDDLSAVHVKQGFINPATQMSDEFGSCLNKMAGFNHAKIWKSFQDILVKKEDVNTFAEVKDKNKRQPINIRDDFWLVTAQKKPLVEKYFKDLAGTKPLSSCAKKVPIFNRRDEIIRALSEFDVPVSRGVWLIKMTAAYAAAMQETNKTKKKVNIDPASEWTTTLKQMVLEQREQLQSLYAGNPGLGLTTGDSELKPENSVPLKQLLYTQEMTFYMYQEGLLDRQDCLQSILDIVEKTKSPDEPLFRLLMPTLLRYCPEFSKSVLLARKMAYQCAKKITHLVLETDAFMSAHTPSNNTTNNSNDNSATSPSKTATIPGTNQPLPPVLSALIELQNDPYNRMIILTLSSLLQTIVLEIPTALVWSPSTDIKANSSLAGSPLDYLPNVAPSSLPMPPRADNQQLRARIRTSEMYIKERSAAAENNWSTSEGSAQSGLYGVVGKILSVLEDLDRYVFDRMDPNSNCLDTLAAKIWGPPQSGQGVTSQDEAVVSILCEWAVTNNRSGEHRGFVAAKLLELRQAELLSPEEEEEKEDDYYIGATPVFQELLFKFLDNEAPFLSSSNPTTKKKHEVGNLVLLFHELMSHDVFSHDAYMCSLISRGDLNNPLQNTKEKEKDVEEANTSDDRINDELGAIVKQISETNKLEDDQTDAGFSTAAQSSNLEVWRYNRHWQFTYHIPIPFPHDEAASHDVNQRNVLLYGYGRGKEESSKNCKKITREILKLFSKRFSIDVNEGGKIKKHHKSEFIFSEVVQKFQDLSYFDQHFVTSQCGQTIIEMVQAFHSCSAVHLPVTEHVSFLFDLAGQALNIQCLLDWCIQLLKELPLVESQLIERGSVLTRTYTTGLALYIVGVLRRYHSVLILTDSTVKSVWESLVKISYRHSNVPQESPRHDGSGVRRPPPNLDCNSAEWCIMGYLFDLAAACPSLLKSSDKYPVLKRLFNQSPDPAMSQYNTSEQFREMISPYILQPRKKVDPLIVRYLHEKPEHQYTLVCCVLSAIVNGPLDTDRLNDLAILCCELTAQCSTLSQEWLGALYSLCCADKQIYSSLHAQVNLKDFSFHPTLGIFVCILIARQCFSLQSIVLNVITRALVKPWNSSENEGNQGQESEAGARLALHLLLKLFRSVECFQPGYYTIASPRSVPVSAHDTGLKFSCDRHLLAATHANISSGIEVGAIIAVLKAMLLLGESAPRTSTDHIPNFLSSGFNEDDLATMSASGRDGVSLGDLAYITLKQICSQEWVRDICLQVPDDLGKPGYLLDNLLPPQQTLSLLRLICHTNKDDNSSPGKSKQQETERVIKNLIGDLDEWSLRASIIDIKLMYRLESKNGEVGTWLEDVSRSIVESFKLGENDLNPDSGDSEDEDGEPDAKKRRLDTNKLCVVKSRKRRFGPIWMIPHLIKSLKFLQTKILQVSGRVLESGNWSRGAKSRISLGHQPFLQLVLTCLRELESLNDGKSRPSEDREHVREQLLQSLHEQLSNFLCFTPEEKVYNYEDPTSRKTMQDALQLRFSLLGGMFDSIINNFQSITEWSTLLVQLVVRGVIDLTNNSDLFCTVMDMLTCLIHSSLVIDKETSSSERAEENRRHYLQLVKRIKKEIGDKQSQSIKYLRQLLPFPKLMEEVIVTEQYGLEPDSKGQKVRGFNCDKKQGLQVSEKQKISPWDILEGFKNPAPLSWHWFQAVKTERKPLKYEEAFHAMRYMKNSFIKDSSHYLSPPPLPQEDLEPSKDAKEDDKNDINKAKVEDMMDPMNPMNGKRGQVMKGRRGNTRIMSPTGAGMSGAMGPGMLPPGAQGMYGPGPNNYPGGPMGYDNMNYNSSSNNTMGPGGPPMGQQQMNYNNMNYNMQGGPAGPMSSQPMQNIPGGARFAGPGMPQTKQALQNMLRSRTTPTQYGAQAGPPQQPMGPIMRPSGQYGGMMPSGQAMGSMNRPMYSGGGMGGMNPNYGMQGSGSYVGYGAGNPQIMNSAAMGKGQPMGMQPSGQYGMSGPMQSGMGMSGMSMSRSGMMGPASGYGMSAAAGQGSYPMQSRGGMGMGGMSGSGGMMPPGMRMAGPGMMSGMQAGSGMSMQGGGGGMMQGGGMMHGGGMGGMGGMPQGGSQLMAHLQRGNSMTGQQGMSYQQSRY